MAESKKTIKKSQIDLKSLGNLAEDQYDSVLADMVLHNASVRRLSHKMFLLGISSLGVAGFAILLALVLFFSRPEPRYFVADADGRIVEVTPVSQPYADPNRLVQWAARAVTDSFSFDFVNYQNKLTDVRQYFTQQGYENFLKALTDSGLVDTVKKNRYVMTAVLRKPPVVLRENVVEGRYVYVVKIPVLLSFYLGNNQFSASWDVEALIIRVPPTENIFGVAIHQIVAKRSDN